MRFNHATIVGRLVRDAELKYSPNGNAILSMRLAFDQGTKDDKSAGFLDVVLFGERGSKIAEWCKKGREILASGRLQYREWEDKNSGGKRSALELIAFDLEFTQPADRSNGEAREGESKRPVTSAAPPNVGQAW